LVTATVAVLSASFARAVLVAIAALLSAVLIFLVALQNSGGPPSADFSATLTILGALRARLCRRRVRHSLSVTFRITPVAVLIRVVAILACALLSCFWPSSLTAYLSNRYAPPQLQIRTNQPRRRSHPT
jgi:hypothetical protein